MIIVGAESLKGKRSDEKLCIDFSWRRDDQEIGERRGASVRYLQYLETMISRYPRLLRRSIALSRSICHGVIDWLRTFTQFRSILSRSDTKTT